MISVRLNQCKEIILEKKVWELKNYLPYTMEHGTRLKLSNPIHPSQIFKKRRSRKNFKQNVNERLIVTKVLPL